MDYKELADAVRMCGSTPKMEQCKKCPFWAGGNMMECIPRMTSDAATAITDLLARAEAAEAELEQRNVYYDQMVDALAAVDSKELEAAKEELKSAEARAEKAERERDAAVRQLASLEICGYCKNGQCTTRGGSKECKWEWNGGKKEE